MTLSILDIPTRYDFEKCSCHLVSAAQTQLKRNVNNNSSPKEKIAVTWTQVKTVNWIVPRSKIKLLDVEIENN